MTCKNKVVCQQLCAYIDKNLVPFLKQQKSADYILRQWGNIKKMIQETSESLFAEKLQRHLKELNNLQPSSSGQYFQQQNEYSLNIQKKFGNYKIESLTDRDIEDKKSLTMDKNTGITINNSFQNSEKNREDSFKKYETLSNQRNLNFGNATISKYELISPSKNSALDLDIQYKALQLGSVKRLGESPVKSSLNSYSDQQGFNNLINCFQRLIRNFENSNFHQISEAPKASEYNYNTDSKSKKTKAAGKSKFQRQFSHFIE